MQRPGEGTQGAGITVPTEILDALESPAFNAALSAAEILVVVVSDDCQVLHANRALTELLGKSPSQLLGVDWCARYVPISMRRRVKRGLRQMLDGKIERVSFDGYVMETPSGERQIAWTHHTLEATDSAPRRICSIGRDVTSMLSSTIERTYRTLKNLKHALDESSIVAITDQRGTITYVNDRFCQISGYGREELLGHDHRLLNSTFHDAEFIRTLWRTIAHGEVWRGDLCNRAKNGSHYWVDTTIVPFLNDAGKPYQFLAIRNEITERVHAKAELERMVRRLAELSETERSRAEALEKANAQLAEAHRQLLEEQKKVLRAEKLSSVGLLASGVAHEINNPLSGVMGCIKAIMAGNLPAAQEEQYLEAMNDGLGRIRDIVKSLLDFARQSPPEVRNVNANELVASCVRLLEAIARKRTIAIAVTLPEEDVFIRGDNSQLMQAVVNILMNAIQASPNRATVNVVVRAGELSERATGPCIAVTVLDRGPGIPKQLLDRICDPFFTTKAEGEGTGLGLAVTLSIIQAHDGDLVFQNRPEGGTRVTMLLPVGRQQSVPPD